MRILWISDSPTTPSGFGGVTRAVCGRLAARGHRIEILGWQAYGALSYWEGIPVRPVRHDQFGSDVLLGYLLRFRPDFLITLADVWWMSFLADPAVQRYFDQSGTRWVHYYPLDGADPDGKLPASWIKVLQAADVPVAMSRFGVEVSRASGIDCAYIPHGCEVGLFAPPADREAAKAQLGYQGSFVLLTDARNQPRKLIPRLLDIAAIFTQGKPDVVVHLHTDPEDDAASSDLYRYRVRQDVEALGLGDRVRFTSGFRMRASGGIPIEELAAIYAAADAHLLCSWGEGFGLPSLQAASAGVVPLAVAYSASQELVEGHGYAIPAESAVLDEFGLVRCLLSREAAAEALEEIYGNRALLAERSRRCREFALGYAWNTVVDQWEEVLRRAPPRRKPVRTRFFSWTAGDEKPPVADLPVPVATAMQEAFATLPDGVRMSVGLAERRYGEVTAEIVRSAFVEGDELSLPVRLPPFFAGAPRARIGNVLISPPELPLAVLLQRVFPGIVPAVPRPGGDPQSTEVLPLERLLPALLHAILVVDYSGTGAPRLDVACAALGIPYVGPSLLWPEIGPPAPFHQVRRLLTDQGLSEWRRQIAAAQAEEAFGAATLERLRTIALAGQPRAAQRPSAEPPGGTPEMFLVRAGESAPDDASERIAEHVARLGGLILMATAGGSLIVAMPPRGKEALEVCPLVGFVGPVQLSGGGKAARALRSRFAASADRQLAARQGGFRQHDPVAMESQ